MLELLKKCKITLAYMALKSKKYEDQSKVIELIKQIDAIIEKNQEGN
jgi:hypothetical protein